MKYDFETIIDRHNKDSIAVDRIPIPNAEVKPGFTKIPMWVADMNYATAPSIIKAIIARAQHPTFGYFDLPPAYFTAIQNWQKRHNGVTVPTEAIGYENGVLGGVSAVIQAYTLPGEAVLLHSPTYIGFTKVMKTIGRKVILSPLQQDAQGVWRMDYEDMDAKIKANQIRVAVFCSPHNPTGRVWEREEIEKAMAVYKANDVIVISDEIWSDMILPGYHHIPTQSVNDDAAQRTAAFYAPSKTFNLAGLVGSYHIIYNEQLRQKTAYAAGMSHYNHANVLSVHALIGAYDGDGDEWLSQLMEVLGHNVDYAYDYIQKHFKGVTLSKPQGTYMLYLNCTEWLTQHHKTMDELLQAGVAVGVIWQDGRSFNYPDSIRINLAVPYSLVVEAFDRLDRYVFNAPVNE